jgi:hypothetical protein
MTGRAPRFLFTFTLVRDLLLPAKHLFVAAILWPSLNPPTPRDDKRVIAMINEAGTDPWDRPTAACPAGALLLALTHGAPRPTRCLKGF